VKLSKRLLLLTGFAVSVGPALADEATTTPAAPKTLSGMSVLGNDEAPTSLVIVPWRSSRIGDGVGLAESLDNRPMPVDREVFERELDYYAIRSGPDTRDSGHVTGKRQ
jgi:hypothetical protein